MNALKWLDRAVIVGAVATVPLVVIDAHGISTPLTTAADWLVWLVFLVDLVGDFRRRAGAAQKSVSFAIVILSFPALHELLALSRLARLTRLAQLLRVAALVPKALPIFQRTVGRRSVRYVASVSLLSVWLGGGLFYLAEPERVGSVWTGLWWAVVTATTVGYGDISPITFLGRMIGVALMFVGIGAFATLGGSVTAFFVGSDTDDRLRRIEERLGRIQASLEDRTQPGPG